MITENKIGDSYWEFAVDVIDLYNGSYGVARRKRQNSNKPVNAWFLKMDVNGNIISYWYDPDYGMLILERKQQEKTSLMVSCMFTMEDSLFFLVLQITIDLD